MCNGSCSVTVSRPSLATLLVEKTECVNVRDLLLGLGLDYLLELHEWLILGSGAGHGISLTDENDASDKLLVGEGPREVHEEVSSQTFVVIIRGQGGDLILLGDRTHCRKRLENGVNGIDNLPDRVREDLDTETSERLDIKMAFEGGDEPSVEIVSPDGFGSLDETVVQTLGNNRDERLKVLIILRQEFASGKHISRSDTVALELILGRFLGEVTTQNNSLEIHNGV